MYGKWTKIRIKEFTDKYGLAVMKAISNTGLYFPAIIGQSAWESGYGENIPLDSNNFAGIKYNPKLEGVIGYVISDTSEYINGKKVRVKAKFSKFKDAESGFKAQVQVLMGERYKKARLEAKSPEQQILMIAKAGYTTTPAEKYLNDMRGLIEASRDYSKLSRIV
jgi:flagellum-specific peptidoglycan hydrolase FlgJ